MRRRKNRKGLAKGRDVAEWQSICLASCQDLGSSLSTTNKNHTQDEKKEKERISLNGMGFRFWLSGRHI